MFWYMSQVKHLLSINETGVLYHLTCRAHTNTEDAGCDSKMRRQLTVNTCLWERGGPATWFHNEASALVGTESTTKPDQSRV